MHNMNESGYLSALDLISHPHEVVHSVALRKVLIKLVKEHEAVCEERTELLRRVNKKWWLKWL